MKRIVFASFLALTIPVASHAAEVQLKGETTKRSGAAASTETTASVTVVFKL